MANRSVRACRPLKPRPERSAARGLDLLAQPLDEGHRGEDVAGPISGVPGDRQGRLRSPSGACHERRATSRQVPTS